MSQNRKKIILGSASPRRKQLLQELFPGLIIKVKDVNEDFSSDLKAEQIPVFLSEQKANAFNGELKNDELLITADTIVWFDDHVLNKPLNREEALYMLQKLSGNSHQVFTGVCISTKQKRTTFFVESEVQFRRAKEKEIPEYIDEYKPYDKAGSYGAQECLPEGMNPLSEKEKFFLNNIGKPDLFENTLAVKHHARFPLIEKISGSYFNVMGMPIVELYEIVENGLI